jgi:hypothetical protein
MTENMGSTSSSGRGLFSFCVQRSDRLWGPINLSVGTGVKGTRPLIFSEATDGSMCPGVDSASKNEYQENSWE